MKQPTCPDPEKQDRLDQANHLLRVISRHGRKFFLHDGSVSRLLLDHRGRIWFWDSYSTKYVYTHYRGRWKGFTNGGTLRWTVEKLADYVGKGTPLPPTLFGPWPSWYCDGDLWGYGDSMEAVREAALPLLQEKVHV